MRVRHLAAALAPVTLVATALFVGRPATATGGGPAVGFAGYQQLRASDGSASRGLLATAAAANAPTATVSDPSGDTLFCQGDLIAARLDYQQPTSLAMGVTTACTSNPNTDPSWTTGSSLTHIGFYMDMNGDGDDEYWAVYAPGLSGSSSVAEVFHTANDDFTEVCTAPAAWNQSTGFSVTIPSSCLGSPSQVQVYAAMIWDPTPTASVKAVVPDFAPDEGWLGPVSPAGAPTTTSPPTTPPSTTTTTTPPLPPAVGQGYWLVASDGGIFSFGNARFWGSTGAIRLNQPIVGMATTPDGFGYWMVASDGGIFSFGNAAFFGSTGAIRLNQPIVGMATTPDGLGYWLVARDGGIFSFGDAKFFGSTGAIRLNQPIVGMALAGGGRGYWFVAADGGVFGFGPDAVFYGSGVGKAPTPVVGIAPSADRLGFRLVTSDGRVETFGDAQHLGDLTGRPLTLPIVGLASN